MANLGATKIRKMDKGITAFFWLCECLVEKQKNGWELLETRPMPFPQECEECRFKRGKLK